VVLTEPEMNLPRHEMEILQWIAWAKQLEVILENRLAQTPAGRSRRQLRNLLVRVSRLAGADESWVVERTETQRVGMSFEPRWPAPYSEQYLWRGAEKVLLLSATMRPQTLRYLGIEEKDCDFFEYPSPFPYQDRRITFIPTVRVTHKTTPDEMLTWVDRIDQIIAGRLDRKGIVHTTSYARARFLVENSRFSDGMFTHNTRTTRDVVAEFKRSPAPAILVSPSVTTGWDFPMEECEYQIIGKIPFPDGRPPIMKARTQEDPNYPGYVAATDIVQATGRGVRGPGDKCETFIVDDSAMWFIPKYKECFPRWWREAYMKSTMIPDAPEVL
jgi:Rad3-related DNA helicase